MVDGCIVLVAKCPIPGKSKTRLIPLLGPQGSAALAQAMLSDMLQNLTELVSKTKQNKIERSEVLETEVKPLLTSFAGKGFAYRDLRWRHILRDANQHLFLADLESLYKIEEPGPDGIKTVVAKQVELLQKSIENPPPAQSRKRRLSDEAETSVVSQGSA